MNRFALTTCLAVVTLASGALTAQAQTLMRASGLTAQLQHQVQLRPAQIHSVCKAQPTVAVSQVSAADARSRWVSQVSAAYGNSWSNWNISLQRQQTAVNGVFVVNYTASARPCRPLNRVLAP